MRAFIAIELPKEIRERLYAFSAGIPGRITRVSEENLHITVLFLGEIGDGQAVRAIEEVNKIDASPFMAEANGVSYFGDSHMQSIFARIDDHGRISSMYRLLREGLSGMTGSGDRKQYVPHATIARAKKDNREVMAFINLNSTNAFGRFEVTSLCVKKSVLTDKGPEYSTIHEHKLNAPVG